MIELHFDKNLNSNVININNAEHANSSNSKLDLSNLDNIHHENCIDLFYFS